MQGEALLLLHTVFKRSGDAKEAACFEGDTPLYIPAKHMLYEDIHNSGEVQRGCACKSGHGGGSNTGTQYLW